MRKCRKMELEKSGRINSNKLNKLDKLNNSNKLSNLNINKSKSNNSNTKAQIETMGLLVVVILVSLILFFVLSYNINKARTPSEDTTEFKDSQAISNFGTTMLETTDPCGRTIRELLTDCAVTKQMTCQGKDSCATANDTINKILNLTLNEWGYSYNLSVYNPQNQIMTVSIDTGCNSSNSKKEITPFGTTYGSMSLVLKTCK